MRFAAARNGKFTAGLDWGKLCFGDTEAHGLYICLVLIIGNDLPVVWVSFSFFLCFKMVVVFSEIADELPELHSPCHLSLYHTLGPNFQN